MYLFIETKHIFRKNTEIYFFRDFIYLLNIQFDRRIKTFDSFKRGFNYFP